MLFKYGCVFIRLFTCFILSLTFHITFINTLKPYTISTVSLITLFLRNKKLITTQLPDKPFLLFRLMCR